MSLFVCVRLGTFTSAGHVCLLRESSFWEATWVCFNARWAPDSSTFFSRSYIGSISRIWRHFQSKTFVKLKKRIVKLFRPSEITTTQGLLLWNNIYVTQKLRFVCFFTIWALYARTIYRIMLGHLSYNWIYWAHKWKLIYNSYRYVRSKKKWKEQKWKDREDGF